MQKFEVECAVVQKPRLASQGDTHRSGGWASPEPVGAAAARLSQAARLCCVP